jgi:hypothetical protein
LKEASYYLEVETRARVCTEVLFHANNKKARFNDFIVQASPLFILWGLEGNGNPSIYPSDRFLSSSLKSISRFTGTALFRRCPLKGPTLL